MLFWEIGRWRRLCWCSWLSIALEAIEKSHLCRCLAARLEVKPFLVCNSLIREIRYSVFRYKMKVVNSTKANDGLIKYMRLLWSLHHRSSEQASTERSYDRQQ